MSKALHRVHINDIYIPLLQNKSRYLVIYGGAGSGKSFFIAQKFVIRLFSEYNQRFLFIRKTKTSIKESMYDITKQVISQMGLMDNCHYTISPMRIHCLTTGSEIIFQGCDNAEKLKSINNVTSMWIEEATEIKEEEFKEINIRMRAQTDYYKQIILSFNPISAKHWIYDYFFAKATDETVRNLHVVRSTYKDNDYLEDQERRLLEDLRLTDPYKYKVSCLGEWGIAEGCVYDVFETFKEPPYAEPDETIYGIDFGFKNPTAVIQVDIYDSTYFVYERIYKRDMTQEQLRLVLNDIITNKTNYIYCDAAEPSRIEDLVRYGFNAHKADKDVKFGIDTVRSLHKDILFHMGNRYLMEEVMNYIYKENNKGDKLEEPKKEYDHALDALRYALHTHLKKPKRDGKITFR